MSANPNTERDLSIEEQIGNAAAEIDRLAWLLARALRLASEEISALRNQTRPAYMFPTRSTPESVLAGLLREAAGA